MDTMADDKRICANCNLPITECQCEHTTTLDREGSKDLPVFREYIRMKYPRLHENLITLMADLITRETGKET